MMPTDAASSTAEDIAPSLDALRWQCRRGMLELDLLLGAFLDHGYAQLNADEQARFVRLLAYPDQALYDLLMGNMASVDAGIGEMVSKVRAAVSRATPTR